MHTENESSSASFKINGGNDTFTEKQKNLFAELDNAEKNTRRTVTRDEHMEVDHRVSKSKNHPPLRVYKRKESIFKRPEAPISRCLPVGRIPNFRLQPNKWKKYTLADVTDEDVSDRGNTRAALSFLRELEERAGNENGDEIMDVLPEKIVFKKTAIAKKNDVQVEEKAVAFRSSKVVMPEYVVGQKQKKEKNNKNTKREWSGKELKLDHLLDEEDCE